MRLTSNCPLIGRAARPLQRRSMQGMTSITEDVLMLDRIIAHTPLGQEQLLFRSLDGIEALSTPFDFSI